MSLEVACVVEEQQRAQHVTAVGWEAKGQANRREGIQ